MLDAVEIVPTGPLEGARRAPTSKSLTNRLLLMAALASGTSRLGDVLRSDDTAVMMAALRRFGAGVVESADGSVEAGRDRRKLRAPAGVISAGLSGTTLRWLAAAALLVDGTVVLDGEPPLRRRPIMPLLRTLEALGAAIVTEDGHPPLRIASGVCAAVTPRSTPQRALSSSRASCWSRRTPTPISSWRSPTSVPAGMWILTLEAMERWGAVARRDGSRYVVTAGRHYRSRDEVVEYDASAAAHLFALAMATGGSVTVPNAVATTQPDAELLEVFGTMGAVVAAAPGGGVSLSRTGSLRPVELDVSTMPTNFRRSPCLAPWRTARPA